MSNEITWEVCKENVQPLRHGRNVSYLNASLQTSDEISHSLMKQKKMLEEEILTDGNLHDPIDPWDRYFKWSQQHFPEGKEDLKNFLQKYIVKFQNSDRYRNDPRYVNAWLTMSQIHDDAPTTFAYMKSKSIGINCASFYIMWAEELEKSGNIKKAHSIYELGEENDAEPTELLSKMRNAFQLRAARSISTKLNENEDDKNKSELDSRRQRQALGSLDGRGKHKVLGTTRIGNTTAGVVRSQPRTSFKENRSSTKFKIFSEDENNEQHCVGNFASMPNNQINSKENTTAPSVWKGAEVQLNRNKTTTAISSSNKPFTICQDVDVPSQEQATPLASRKLSKSVEVILTERKWKKHEESDFHRAIREQHGDADHNVVRMYPVEKVYSAVGEFQPEEILAACWLKKQREEEEQKRLQRQLEEQRKQIVESERREIEAQRAYDDKVNQLKHREQQLRNLLQLFKDKEMQIEDKVEMVKEEQEMTIALHKVCSQLQHMQQKNNIVEVATSSQAIQGGKSLLEDEVMECKPSSPTVCTKEAMGEIFGMFQKPLNTDVNVTKHEPSMMQQSQFSIYCDAEMKDKTPVKFDIYEDASDNSENIPTPEYKQAPKREGLSGILQPAVGFKLEEDDFDDDGKDEDERLFDDVYPLCDDNQSLYLDDRTVARAPMEKTTKNTEFPESSFLNTLSHNPPSLQSTMHVTNEIGDDFNNPHFSAESTTRWGGGATTATTTEEGVVKLSPILEATNEYEKSMSTKYQSGLVSLIPSMHRTNVSTAATEKFKFGAIGLEDDITIPEQSRLVDSDVIDESQAIDYDFKDLCDELMSTSLCKTTIDLMPDGIGDLSKPSLGLNIIPDPWNDQLLQGLIPSTLEGVIVASESKVFRKGSDVRIGNETYHLVKEIGKGAFAKAYKATMVSGDEVAVKVQSPAYKWEIHMLQEVRRRLEAKGHDVCKDYMTIMTAAVFQNSSCVVTQYLPSGTLLDFLNTNKNNTVDRENIALQIFHLVHSLHAIGVIHGDVKPDNILIANVSNRGPAPTLRLIDFGRAIDLSSLPPNTAFTDNCGTSGFVCSQMKTNQPWNYHIDFNGVAGTLHVLLHSAYMKTMLNNKQEWVTTKKLPRWCDEKWSSAFHDLLNFPTPTNDWCPSLQDSPLPHLIQLFDA
nr:mitotic checkpoint serine/threonine-protein kinase BUB1 [Ciona intestinalis]|eukprot:XP_026692557.1 mitotic checkpoint serine/threonine-protein kinase BUB1 [Ciona intestinalis]